jgi:hypothetical protein
MCYLRLRTTTPLSDAAKADRHGVALPDKIDSMLDGLEEALLT